MAKRDRTVALIINDDDLLAILVMHRNKQGKKYYVFPGGGIEKGETPEQAVIREIGEETSLKVKVERQIYEHRYDNGEKQFFFLCTYLDGSPSIRAGTNESDSNKIGDDSYEPVWIKIDGLEKTLIYPLEIRDWFIQDFPDKFPQEVRVDNIRLSEIRHEL